MQQNYEVLRFVQQSGMYHVVMDYVEGEVLCNFLRKESLMDKETVIQLILLIAKELSYLEKSDAEEMYPCLTPLHIVVKKDNTISFLKAGEKYNRQISEKAQLFMIPDGTKDYIYSYGKTVQFLLSNIECVPKLTWKEERKFQAIISKCLNYKSKKRYRNGQDIANQLNPKKKKSIMFIMLFTILPVLVLGICGRARHEEQMKITANPQESFYKILREYLDGVSDKSLDEIEQVTGNYRESLDDEMSVAQMEFLFQIYCQLDNDYGKEQALLIGDEMFEAVADNREIIANIYLEQENYEEAIGEFDILIKESPSVERYTSLANLLEQRGRQREAMKLCEEGSKLDPEGVDLQLQYVRLLLMDSEYSVNEKKSKLEEFLCLYPMISELPKFQEIKKMTGFEEASVED